jgi:hypothetical protein
MFLTQDALNKFSRRHCERGEAIQHLVFPNIPGLP